MNPKKSEPVQRKSHNLIRYDKLNKLKQLGFTTSWNINDQKKDYNALQDPHADRYFKYQSVKVHMKDFRRSLNKSQKNEAEKKRIAKLIKEKLSDHLPAIKVAAQTYNIPNEQLNKSQVTCGLNNERSFKGLNKQKSLTEFAVKHYKKSKSKRKKHSTDQSAKISFNNDNNNDNTESKESSLANAKVYTESNHNLAHGSQKSLRLDEQKETERKEYVKKQQEILHKKRHEDFISFIAKKRETLQSASNLHAQQGS